MYSPLLRKHSCGNELRHLVPHPTATPEPGSAPPLLHAEKDTLIQRFPAWKYFEENKDGGRFECRTPTTWRGPWGLLSNVWSLVFSLFKETLIERYFIFFVIILRYWNNMKLWYKQKVTSIINTILHLSICHTFKNYRCSLRRYCFRYSEESFTLFKIMLKCSCKCNILIFLLVLTKQY